MSGTLFTNDTEERLGFGGLANLPPGVVVQFSEQGASADAPSQDSTKAVGTGLTFTPQPAFDQTHVETEPLAFTPAQDKDFTDAQVTTLTITPAITVVGSFEREGNTGLGLVPAYFRSITVEHTETLTLLPRLLRPANARFFNASIRSRALSGDELTRHLTGFAPADHTPFQNFLPGDYTFQQALVGIRLSAPANVDTPAIFDTVVNTDLPDIVENGQLTTVVTTSPANNGWSAVLFNKDFNHVPSVLVTPLSGAEAVTWETRNITVDGFEVRTLSLSSASPVGGIVVGWTAIGI